MVNFNCLFNSLFRLAPSIKALHYWPFVRKSIVDWNNCSILTRTKFEFWSFDVFSVDSLSKLLNKQLSCQWFDMTLHSCGIIGFSCLIIYPYNPVNPDKIVWALFQASLTHWGWDEIDAISQTTFWNAFSLMKMYWLRLRFHWNLFPRV